MLKPDYAVASRLRLPAQKAEGGINQRRAPYNEASSSPQRMRAEVPFRLTERIALPMNTR